MEERDYVAARRPSIPGLRRLNVWWLAAGLAALAVGGWLSAVGIRELHATTAPSIEVNPPSVTQLYYRTSPFEVRINAAYLSGFGQTPVSGYQYGLQWDPTILKWLSGPVTGPGTATPAPVLPCSRQIITWGTPTSTPTFLIPTWTPTSTNTPGPGTPTNTPTSTFTASPTPTPGGYIQVACATLSNATPLPSGVLGVFQFQPLVTSTPASSVLNLINVLMLDHNGNPVTPGPNAISGAASFLPCYDVNADGSVDIIDLSLVANSFLATIGQPGYVPAYDVNSDGSIDIVDLSILAAEFLFVC